MTERINTSNNAILEIADAISLVNGILDSIKSLQGYSSKAHIADIIKDIESISEVIKSKSSTETFIQLNTTMAEKYPDLVSQSKGTLVSIDACLLDNFNEDEHRTILVNVVATLKIKIDNIDKAEAVHTVLKGVEFSTKAFGLITNNEM